MKTKLIISVLTTAIAASSFAAVASAATNDSTSQTTSASVAVDNKSEFEKALKEFEKQTLTVDEVLNNPLFADLPKNEAAITLYKEIETFKKKNANLNSSQVVEHFNKKGSVEGIGIYSVYDEWNNLTTSEKLLIASSPANAALTVQTKDQAFALTQTHMGKNGLGDKSDAFRHAIWNALMCRYISKSWASSYATAHEDKSAEELKQVASDGYLESSHRDMDLHNNQKGRDTWNVLTDGVLWTSDADLVTRVKQKMAGGELIWLHT